MSLESSGSGSYSDSLLSSSSTSSSTSSSESDSLLNQTDTVCDRDSESSDNDQLSYSSDTLSSSSDSDSSEYHSYFCRNEQSNGGTGNTFKKKIKKIISQRKRNNPLRERTSTMFDIPEVS